MNASAADDSQQGGVDSVGDRVTTTTAAAAGSGHEDHSGPDRDGETGVRTGEGNHAARVSTEVRDVADAEVGPSPYTPLFRSQHEDRYLRRDLIREYERVHQCRLIVLIDQIDPTSITYFAELLHGSSGDQDLHLMLWSPGGAAETAVRLCRMAQDASRRLTVLVPDIAKSAATVLCLGAHHIVMGPTSDLGPIDPQVPVPGRGYVGAKDLITAVQGALDDVNERPNTYAIHAAMLAGIDETQYQFAKSALAATTEIAEKALSSHPDRSPEDVQTLMQGIQQHLITQPNLHSAVVGPAEAKEAGLPIQELSLADSWWQMIWSLWTRYFVLAPEPWNLRVYESANASQVQVLS